MFSETAIVILNLTRLHMLTNKAKELLNPLLRGNEKGLKVLENKRFKEPRNIILFKIVYPVLGTLPTKKNNNNKIPQLTIVSMR